MIRKLSAAAFYIALVTLVSCAGSDNKDYIDKSLISPAAENKPLQPSDTIIPVVQSTATQPNNPLVNTIAPTTNSITVGPNNSPVSITPAVPATTNTQTSAQPTAPGMNPPHGQPGHRCDIEVGAPLNSKPVQPAAQATTVTTTPQQTATQPTAPGMNPPHGQPGHRCDIAVGAPLNSQPVQPTATPVNISTENKKPDSLKNR